MLEVSSDCQARRLPGGRAVTLLDMGCGLEAGLSGVRGQPSLSFVWGL